VSPEKLEPDRQRVADDETFVSDSLVAYVSFSFFIFFYWLIFFLFLRRRLRRKQEKESQEANRK